MKIAISGLHGMIGSYLNEFFKYKGWQVIAITRENVDLEETFFGAEVVINLSGENIGNGRWTKKKKTKILESRLNFTKKLVNRISNLKNPPKLFISASAVGYYGSNPGYVKDEFCPPGDDFLANVCIQWESAAKSFTKGRLITARFGVVLSHSGGLLKKMILLGKCFLLGRVGDGNQIISWIAIEDVAEIFLQCIENHNIKGPINLTSPNPITNKDLVNDITTYLHKPSFLPLPAFLVKFLFGEKGPALLLANQFIQPEKLLNLGYKFKYNHFSECLKNHD
jgi:uncharacterized protein (TIGR01777 family)